MNGMKRRKKKPHKNRKMNDKKNKIVIVLSQN